MASESVYPIKRALLSVFDKTGIVELARTLHDAGAQILSTGGTARLLNEAGIPITEVGAYTGHPEMLDGRVKTLHPRIHGGILGRRDLDSHKEQMDAHDIGTIDLVAVNLYPFEAVAGKPDATWPELIENIDIGGPSMLRSAAKNHDAVTVLADPADYGRVIEAIKVQGGTDRSLRQELAIKAFARTAAYDAVISTTLAARAEALHDEPPECSKAGLGPYFASFGQRAQILRYGENPHQQAGVYATGADELDLASAIPLQGKALSYNNLLDADAALFALRCLVDDTDASPGAVVIKHGTPCGAGRGRSPLEAWVAALSGDPVSAFGGIVAVNFEVDDETAAAMGETFLEVVLAPGYSAEALERFSAKKNLRLISLPGIAGARLPRFQTRSVAGGLLVQEQDRAFTRIRSAEVVTERRPTDDEWAALDVAFRMCTAVRSNAITLASDDRLLGAGGGQTSRVDAVRIAVEKARTHGHDTKGAALGSDAFFPFADGLLVAVEAGVTAVAQPGGSKRDDEVIAAANKHGVTMVFTNERHFRH